MIRKLWNGPVWSKVIAGLILMFIATIGTYFLNWWPIITNFIKTCLRIVFSFTTIPNWLLGLLSLLSLLAILFVCRVVWVKLNSSKHDKPDWRTYTNDNFFGLRWRWTYFSDGAIRNLTSYCLDCDYQVFPKHASMYSAVDRIGFFCENCGKNLCEFKESQRSLENRVERLIQQKLRNNTWIVSI